MKYEHKELIHDYLNLKGRIAGIEGRMERCRVDFNKQSFCGGTSFDLLGVRYRGFRVDDRVTGHVDLMNTYKRQIAMNERRLSYFNDFLEGLDPHTRASLIRRYKRISYNDDYQDLGHDRIVLDEIVEIEEAVSYEFGTALSNELQRDVIQVEYTLFSEDTVEDSFQVMQTLLGV